MKYISNSFSLQMVEAKNGLIGFKELSEDDFKFKTRNATSVVGHFDTAKLLNVKFNRKNISLKKGDVLFVAQVIGGRLPEGATTLPNGFKFKFMQIEVL